MRWDYTKMSSKTMRTRKDLRAELWRASNIMRSDDGTTGIYEYIEQLSWMFFLKVFENLEDRFAAESQLENKEYTRIIPKKYSWSQWITIDSREISDTDCSVPAISLPKGCEGQISASSIIPARPAGESFVARISS